MKPASQIFSRDRDYRTPHIRRPSKKRNIPCLVNWPVSPNFRRVGPLVAIIAFVCSVGNIPLAAVLWNGGISFGGVLAFILADLIVLPILNIYRKYYGLKMAAFLLVTFYVAMAAAALAVEGLFGVLGFIPRERQARVVEASITWNYTTWLNIGFLLLPALLVWWFVKTGGIIMLRIMNRPARGDEAHHHVH
jgi:uncharacterized membrane protein YraQ (UPF0718 family)